MIDINNKFQDALLRLNIWSHYFQDFQLRNKIKDLIRLRSYRSENDFCNLNGLKIWTNSDMNQVNETQIKILSSEQN